MRSVNIYMKFASPIGLDLKGFLNPNNLCIPLGAYKFKAQNIAFVC